MRCPEAASLAGFDLVGSLWFAASGVWLSFFGLAAYHGIAVNIATELSKFERIIACGIAGQQQGSLHSCGLALLPAAAFDAALRGRFIVDHH